MGPRDGQPILIRPRRESLSRAGQVVAIGGLPWALLVVIGAAALFSAVGIAIPAIPAGVRLFIAGVAIAPVLIALPAGLFGPVPGLRWLFDTDRGLLVDDAGLKLIVGNEERWAVGWAAIEGLEAVGFPERLEIRRRGADALSLPASLARGRIAGTRQVVDVVTLIATEVERRRRDVPSGEA